MKYKQLSTDYQDDVIAEAMYSREVEYFHYDFDRVNFKKMLETLPEGEYRNMITNRLEETETQMANVQNIYNALQAQVTDQDRHAAAVARMAAKRQAVTAK